MVCAMHKVLFFVHEMIFRYNTHKRVCAWHENRDKKPLLKNLLAADSFIVESPEFDIAGDDGPETDVFIEYNFNMFFESEKV